MHIPFPRISVSTDEDRDKVTSPGTKMLMAMAALGKPVYPGTVSEATKAKRRAKNKVARASRKANR